MKILNVVLLAAWATLPLEPKHFRFTRAIQTSAGNGLFRIDLPESVYQGVAHDDLRDVRVFNKDGTAVPSSFQRSDREEVTRTDTRDLTFYPVLGDASTAYEGASRVAMTETAGGTRSVVVQFGESAKSGKAVPRGYLVEVKEDRQSLRRLELDWKDGAETGFFSVRVEGSDDLATWRPLAPATTLARFQFGGNRLERNALELPDVRTKYVLLTWTEQRSLPVGAIRGVFAHSGWIEPQRHATKVATRREKTGEYVFEKTPVLADQLAVTLPEVNTLVRVELFSRTDAKAPWQSRASGLLYRIKTDVGEVTAQPLTFAPTSDRQWMLKLVGSDASLGSTPPEVEFRWIAHQLFFVAQGSGPFVLAYGQPQAEAADFGVASVTGALAGTDHAFQPALAEVSAEVAQNPEVPTAAPAADASSAAKKYVLWALLVGGVLLTSFMAWKLLRELKPQENKG